MLMERACTSLSSLHPFGALKSPLLFIFRFLYLICLCILFIANKPYFLLLKQLVSLCEGIMLLLLLIGSMMFHDRYY